LIVCPLAIQAQSDTSQTPVTTQTKENISAKGNFPIIILIGRPAAGKSEIINFLKNTPIKEREKNFHIGAFTQIDDFPFIWDWFEEDMILAKYSKKRLYTDSKFYFKDEFLWDVLIEKINAAVENKMQEDEAQNKKETIIIEFSRGTKVGGYKEALSYLSPDILKKAVIIYVDVSFNESMRRNQFRAVKGMEHSILHHSVPTDKMEYYYKTDDWKQITQDKSFGIIDVKGNKIPFAVLSNEHNVTGSSETLYPALKNAFDELVTEKH